MPGLQERFLLTIELTREGADLLRRYFVPAQGELAPHRSAFDAIGADYWQGTDRQRKALPQGLTLLHDVLAGGDKAELDRRLSGGHLDRVGAMLFEVLFGVGQAWEPVLRAAFHRPAPQPQPDPGRYPLRVRICTRDPLLQGLPWRASMWAGQLLLDAGWSFEVCHDIATERDVDFRAPGSILVIAPDFVDMAPVGTVAHLKALGQVLDSLSPGHSASSRFRVVRSIEQIERELPGMQPDIIYFYGHGEVKDGQLALQLGDGRRESCLLRDLARLIAKHPPHVVYLNGCQTGQAGWHSAGVQLLPHVPVVIANATATWSEAASRFALQWLAAWLREGLDPVLALHRLGGRESTGGFAWITPVVHTHYRSFTMARSTQASRLPYFPIDWLDREEQRSRAFSFISELSRDPQRRVIAVVAYAEPGNALEKLSDQIIARIESEAGERIHIRHFTLKFPENPSPESLGASLEQGLKIQLRYEVDAPLEHVLRARAPRRMGNAVPILWLDWGVFSDTKTRQPSLNSDQVTAWLKFVRNQIASVCPDNLRVIASMALEIEPVRIERLDRKLRGLANDPNYRNAKFRIRVIPLLGDVELSEILDYLDRTDCPEGLRHELAKLIFDSTQGRYEETVNLLRQGPPAWYPLRDELQNAGPPQSSW